MKKFIFMVVMSVAVGALMYMNDPASRSVPDKVTEEAPAGNAMSVKDRIWAWFDGDSGSSAQSSTTAAGHTSPESKLQDDPPPTAEALRNAENSIVNTTDRRFESDVMQSPVSVVLEFWRPGCPYCVKLDPELVKLAAGLSDSFKIVKVNTRECPETRNRFPITGVPTMFLFENGKIVKTLHARTARELKNELGHN